MPSVADIIIQLMQVVAVSDTDTNNAGNVQEMPIGRKSDGDTQFTTTQPSPQPLVKIDSNK